MSAIYEGDYRCQSNDGPEEPCRKVATKCYREPYTPSRTPFILCDEHAEEQKALGYHLDVGATSQLLRDVEAERDEMEAA